MDKNAILIAFSLPALLALFGVWNGVNATEGWGAIAAGITIFVAFIAALAAGITVFFLRSRQLRWWHGLIISLGSLIVAFIVLALIGFIQHLTAPAPLLN